MSTPTQEDVIANILRSLICGTAHDTVDTLSQILTHVTSLTEQGVTIMEALVHLQQQVAAMQGAQATLGSAVQTAVDSAIAEITRVEAIVTALKANPDAAQVDAQADLLADSTANLNQLAQSLTAVAATLSAVEAPAAAPAAPVAPAPDNGAVGTAPVDAAPVDAAPAPAAPVDAAPAPAAPAAPAAPVEAQPSSSTLPPQ